jgi:hypothetical protein
MLLHLFAMHDDRIRQVIEFVPFRVLELIYIQFVNRHDPACVRGLLQPGEYDL